MASTLNNVRFRSRVKVCLSFYSRAVYAFLTFFKDPGYGECLLVMTLSSAMLPFRSQGTQRSLIIRRHACVQLFTQPWFQVLSVCLVPAWVSGQLGGVSTQPGVPYSTSFIAGILKFLRRPWFQLAPSVILRSRMEAAHVTPATASSGNFQNRLFQVGELSVHFREGQRGTPSPLRLLIT